MRGLQRPGAPRAFITLLLFPPPVTAMFLAGSGRAGECEALVWRQGALQTCGRPRQHLES